MSVMHKVENSVLLEGDMAKTQSAGFIDSAIFTNSRIHSGNPLPTKKMLAMPLYPIILAMHLNLFILAIPQYITTLCFDININKYGNLRSVITWLIQDHMNTKKFSLLDRVRSTSFFFLWDRSVLNCVFIFFSKDTIPFSISFQFLNTH